MKKSLSIVLCLALVFSMFSTMGMSKAEASSEWNAERYGDIIDIGPYLRAQDKDPEYREKLDKRIKKMAENFNFNEDSMGILNEEEGDFTFDGGTKIFMGYDPIYGNYLKTYTLRSIGENVEVWVANDLAFYTPIFNEDGDWVDEELNPSRPAHIITQEQVDLMRDEFDTKVYPIDTEFFGMPNNHTGEYADFTTWFSEDYGDQVNYTPENYIPEGYEVKERVVILVDNIRDENHYDPNYPFIIAGFYSSTYQDYFDRNIINIDSSNWETRLVPDWLPTTAHEFQHLIHDDNDADEENWINEGMSDFAEYLCFAEHNWGHINFFLDHPENSLVEWDEHYEAVTGPETLADYGQAYLMQLYLRDHYGADFIRSLATNETNGIESMNEVLDEFKEPIDFEELFRRFTIAVAIDDSKIQGGIYGFDSLDLNVSYESALEYDKDGVPAWGADYKELDFTQKIDNIIIDGVEYLPTPWTVVDDPLDSEEIVLWGNNGHLRDNQIIIEADLTGVNTATLEFDNYIDIEEDWDAGIVQVSADNGETWTSLANENTVDQTTFPLNDQVPQIYENLPGFTGYYNEWTRESFDLSEYAGQKIYINFRYMTDGAYNDDGWFIDNIEIPEIGYTNDCTNTNEFISIDELKQIEVEYAITFINEQTIKGNSKYQIISVDPFSITEEDVLQIKQLFKEGKNYMIVWYAAPIGKSNYVPFAYEVILKSDNTKDKVNENKSVKDNKPDNEEVVKDKPSKVKK